MASLIMTSTADKQRSQQVQTAVNDGNLPVMTTITKRPSDFPCWQGVYYGGQWYPPSDPRGEELEKMRYMLPASVAVNPPKTYRCGVCGGNSLGLVYQGGAYFHLAAGFCCIDAVDQWLEVLDLVRDRGRPEQFIKCDGCGVDYHYEVVHILDNRILCHKCHDAAKAVEAKPVVLGQIEIQMGYNEYTRPGIIVGHSAQGKCLFVTLYLNGRMGKQRNWYPVHLRRREDRLDLDTGGARGCTITLAEWQAFIDQVDVRVSSISQNTVKLTPELVKMARDVRAFRREAPTDLKWAAENGAAVKPASEADLLKVWQEWMDAEVEANHNGFDTEYSGFILVGNLELVKETGPRDFRDLAFRHSGIQLDELGEQCDLVRYRYSLALANRGSDLLPSKAHDASRGDVPDFDITPHSDSIIVHRLNELSEVLRAIKTSAGARQASPEPARAPKLHPPKKEPSKAERACRRLSESKGHWDAMWQAQQRWHEARKAGEAKRDSNVVEAAPKSAPTLPQLLQSKEDALEAAAMSKLPVSPEKVDELVEAIKVAISEWQTNADARILPDGYYLRCQPDNALVPTYILLAHPDHPNRVVVGELSIMTDKDTHSELEFVSNRGEIREYMHRVAAGMALSTNGKLAGILVQQPIPEDAKAISRSAGGNEFADVAAIDDLPLFAPDSDPQEIA